LLRYQHLCCSSQLSFPTRRSSDLGPAEQPFLCLPGSSIHFGQRKIAPRMYVEQPIVRLDIGEKLNPRTPFAVGHDDADEQRNRRSEEHTSELQSRENLVCRLLLEK